MNFVSLKCWIILCAVFTLAAQAEPKIKVSKIENKRRKPFAVEHKAEWFWQTNKENVRTLKLKVTLESPKFSRYRKARGLRKSTFASLTGKTLVVQFNRLSEKILLKDRSWLVLDISNRHKRKNPVVDENCKKFSLVLKSVEDKVPFYLGTSCEKVEEGTAFALTFPREVRLTSSTLFETRGKGEPWHYYMLGKIDLASGVLGQFTFDYRGKSYDFSLESLLSQAKEDDAQNIIFLTGVGYASLGISGSDINISDAKPSLILRVPHYPLKFNFGIVLDLDIALPLSEGINAIKYTQFGVFGDYEIPLGSAITLRPKVGYQVSSQSNDTTSVALSANEIAFGLGSEILLGTHYFIGISFIMCGLTSEVIRSHYAIDLTFTRKKKNSLGWGIGGRIQSYSAASELAIERKFSQYLFYASVAF